MTIRHKANMLNLKETEMYYIIGKALKRTFSLPQNELFFEVPVCNSRADILYVQVPEPFDTALAPGVHVFEVKMRWDNDKKRMYKQIDDYMESVDYVWTIGVNHVLSMENVNVGVVAFSTLSCKLKVMRPASLSRRVNISKRQSILTDIASKLRKKYKLVADMARVNPIGECRILVQEKLVV